jgi:hypothetical protein
VAGEEILFHHNEPGLNRPLMQCEYPQSVSKNGIECKIGLVARSRLASFVIAGDVTSCNCSMLWPFKKANIGLDLSSDELQLSSREQFNSKVLNSRRKTYIFL